MKPALIALMMGLCLPLAGADKEKPLPKDFKSLKALAEKGDAKAQYNLGVSYAKGQGVEQDFKEAVKWFRKAAEQGDAKAQNVLGRMYFKGEGERHDLVAAYAWMSISASNSDSASVRHKKMYAGFLDSDQITKAEALVKEMIKENPKLLKKK